VSAQPSFRALFGVDPRASGRAPGRVNLMGDHTDYNGGYVLPTVIPQQTTAEGAPIGGAGAHVIHSTTLERRLTAGAAPLADFARYVGGAIRVLESEGVVVPSLRIRIDSEVPVGAGLSSSAALEVATLRMLRELLGLAIDDERLAMLAHRAETEFAGVACGIMDQFACSLGKPDRMLFLDTKTLERRLLPLPSGAELLVVHSGIPRALAESAYNLRRAECAEAARLLGVRSLREVGAPSEVERLPSPLRERARHVVSENARVLAALTADATSFGALMNRSHASLRDDYQVSLPALDALVERLQAMPETYGARLTGAGFGGCCVALVRSGSARALGAAIAQWPGEPRAWVVVPPSANAA